MVRHREHFEALFSRTRMESLMDRHVKPFGMDCKDVKEEEEVRKTKNLFLGTLIYLPCVLVSSSFPFHILFPSTNILPAFLSFRGFLKCNVAYMCEARACVCRRWVISLGLNVSGCLRMLFEFIVTIVVLGLCFVHV